MTDRGCFGVGVDNGYGARVQAALDQFKSAESRAETAGGTYSDHQGVVKSQEEDVRAMVAEQREQLVARLSGLESMRARLLRDAAQAEVEAAAVLRKIASADAFLAQGKAGCE